MAFSIGRSAKMYARTVLVTRPIKGKVIMFIIQRVLSFLLLGSFSLKHAKYGFWRGLPVHCPPPYFFPLVVAITI